MRYCSIEGCNNTHLSRGWCSKHYWRWNKYGDPNYKVRKAIRHGLSSDNRYKIWLGILERTTNESHTSYSRYGARGIKVCDRWLGAEGFSNFIKDVGERPSSKHTLDRINNDGNYEPDNCRWATRSQQQANRRASSKNNFGYKGITKFKGSWRATIHVNGSNLYLGRFDTPEDAAKAYNIAAYKAWQEYALLNDV